MTHPDRSDVIAGLRALADFLEREPKLPVPKFAHAVTWTFYEDAGLPKTAAEVAEVAKILDVEPRVEGNTVKVAREFSGNVEYKIEVDAEKVCERRPVEREEFVLPPELTNGGEAIKPMGVL